MIMMSAPTSNSTMFALTAIVPLVMSACGSVPDRSPTPGGDGTPHATVSSPSTATLPPATSPSSPHPGSESPGAGDEVMIVAPSAVSSGDLVEVRFREPTDRGIAYNLERKIDGSWEIAFQLISDQRGGPPLWRPVGDELEVDLVGISGTGPDHVQIPPPAQPGSYRLCVWRAPVCAAITIKS
jgi:hypothetical protein